MYKIYIFMQCAPNTYEFFQPMFGLRVDVEIGEMSSADFDTSLIDRLIFLNTPSCMSAFYLKGYRK